jgi:hypothetical protein
MEVLQKKLKLELPYDPTIPLPCMYLKDCKSAYSRDSCTHMFIAALFTIVKSRNYSECPSADKWIKKM